MKIEITERDIARASSGTIEKVFHGSTTGGYRLGITWKVNSQSVASNSSNVTASVYIKSVGNGYTINSSASKNVSLTINGTAYSGTCTVGIGANSTKTLFSRTVTVGHNSDGSKTCAFACSLGINVTLSGKYYGTISHSGNGTFDKLNLNTAPWWTSNDTRIKWNNTEIRAHVIIPENVSTVEVISSTATDTQSGGNLHYDLHRYINGNYSAQIKYGGSGLTANDNLSSFGQGTRIKYEAKVHDGSLWAPDSRWSWEYTKNTFTRASVDSIGSIGINTHAVSFRAYGIRNSGGGNGYVNTSFGYRIESLTSGVSIGGTNTHYQDNQNDVYFTLGVKNNGGNPTNPHWVDANQLRAAFRGSYTGNLRLRLVTWNSYGSQGIYDFNIWVDLRKAAPSTTITYGANNKITHKGTDYYIPAHLPFQISWTAVTDTVEGNACTYDLYYQIGDESYVFLGSTSSNSYTAYLGSTAIGNRRLSNFRIIVRVKTVYGYHTDVGGARIELWDYALPTIKADPKRERDNVIIDGTITINSSIPNIELREVHYRWQGESNIHFDSIVTGTSYTKSFSLSVPADENKTGSIHLASSDTVMKELAKVIGDRWGNTDVTIKAFMPLMTLNRNGLGVGVRLPDSTYKFGVEGDMITTGLNISGYRTSNSSNTHIGQWTKVADLTITGQYGDTVSLIKFVGNGSGDPTATSGEILVRLKQQNPMGQAPVGSLYLNCATDVGPDNFKLIITQNTANLTRGELWYKSVRGYEAVRFSPVSTAGQIKFYSEQGYQTGLPGGTQISCVSNTVSRINTTSKGANFNGIPSIGSDGVMEVGKYIDFHMTHTEADDYSYRIQCDSAGNLTFSGNLYMQNLSSNVITTRGYISLPNNGGSWLNGATNGNIRGSQQSSGSYHSVISQTTANNHKISLGGLGDDFGFHTYLANRTENGIDRYFRFACGEDRIRTNFSLQTNNHIRIEGNNAYYFETHGGGWHMSDTTWVRTWNGKSIYSGNGNIKTENTIICHILEDKIGAANACYVDNAAGGNSQITLRPDVDNKGNLGHRNYTWNYANITSVGNTYSINPNVAYNVSRFTNNELMYDMVKSMNFYLEKEKSVEEFQEEIDLKQTDEYINADEDTQKDMLRTLDKKIPAKYYYSQRAKLVANAEELPFEVAPESHVSDGSRTIEIGSFVAGIASALQKAIEKIEILEEKMSKLEGGN